MPKTDRMFFARISAMNCGRLQKKRKLERLEPDVWSFNRDAVRFCEAAGFETYRQYMEVKT